MSKLPEPIDYSKSKADGENVSPSGTVPPVRPVPAPQSQQQSQPHPLAKAPPAEVGGPCGLGVHVHVPSGGQPVGHCRVHVRIGNCNESGVKLGSQDDILRAIQCPVCLDTAFPPAYMCLNGHLVCGRCRPKVVNCGLCGAKFGNTRNYSVEAIINVSQFRCPNAHIGCPAVLKGEHMFAHMNDCQFGEVLCNEKHGTNMCSGVRIPIGQYTDHVKRIHQYEEIFHATFSYTNRVITIPGTGICQPTPCLFHPQIVYFDNRSFLIHRQEIFGLYYTWVKIIGRESEAKNYCVKIGLKSSTQPEVQVEWVIPVHGIHVKFPQVQANGLSAVISTSALSPYLKAPPHPRHDGNHELYWTAHFDFIKRTGHPVRVQCPYSKYSPGSTNFNPADIVMN